MNHWYVQQQQPQTRRPTVYQPAQPAGPSTSGNTVDAVHDAHRLLTVYPFASATPTNHVARHLNSLSLTATPPSYYIQPTTYAPHIAPNPQQYPSQYSEYAQEITHLASPNGSYDDSGYWESQRNEAVRYIGQQETSYPYHNNSQWSNGYSNPSAYQTTPFAQSIFQHTAPSAAYPTPPPPGISSSSSSLAMALNEPVPRAVARTYRAEDSPAFFNNFIEKQKADLKPAKFDGVHIEVTPRHLKKPSRTSSPDPLALPHTPQTSRKRKAMQALESPSIKRQPVQNGHTPVPMAADRPTPSTMIATPTPRTKLQPVVELPPVPKMFMTPSQKGKGRMRDEDYNDLGGFVSGSEDGAYSPRKPASSNVMSSGRRATGDRDDRSPLDKFMALLDDIFEAEDALPPDIDVSELPAEFFSSLTTESAHPLLHRSILTKLTKLIMKGGAHSRQNTRESTHSNGSPRKMKKTFATIETAVLSRLLRLLERSVKAGEDLDPFGTASVDRTVRKVEQSPRKPKAKKAAKSEIRRSASATPRPTEDMETEDRSDSSPQELTEVDLETLSRTLEVARESLCATECCLTLLSSDRLQKQLYSEELITSCLSAVKNQLTKIIYPFVEASSDMTTHIPPLLLYVIQSTSSESEHRRQIAEVFHTIQAILPRINDLVCADSMSMSEAIVIQAVYVAIGPFFVVEGGNDSKGKEKKGNVVLTTLGSSAMRGLRLDALALIRSIFANYEDQRGWIIEEILSSLIKLSDTKQKAGQFRLRDGRSIRTVSALLMQLVQTSAHDVRVDIDSLRAARQQELLLRRQDTWPGDGQEPFLDEKDMEELRLYTSGLDSASKAARTIIVFLTHRSGKTKSTKNTNEAEYRAIFDNLIADLLTVLFWPEWPAAALILGVATRYMVSSLDDVKTAQSENNAAKTMALDHLGVIAARLRPSGMRTHRAYEADISLSSMDENFTRRDIQGLQALISAHHDVSVFLCRHAGNDQSYDSARELGIVMLGQELAVTLKQCAQVLEDDEDEDGTREQLVHYGRQLKDALQRIWDDHDVDVFNSGNSEKETQRIDHLAEEVGMTQGLRGCFNPILATVLQALDAPPVFMRTKALKALGQIVTSDPNILSASNVRRAIESHLLDSSAAVRDAAVELIGKYIVESPELAGDYYQKVADRIADTGLGVRKRVLKLLKSFYAVTDDRTKRIDICTRIVLRMLDEDDTVKDLAMKTLEELWFSDTSDGSRMKASTPLGSSEKPELLTKISVIMGVSANFKDRHSPLEDLLHKLMSDKEGADADALHRRYAEICELLIDGLVDASDLPGFTVINCVRTIYLVTSAYPAVLTTSHASTLLPYLKSSSTPEDQVTSDYLLRIYRASIPYLPKTASKFGQELQTALQPMIVKPSPAAGVAGLQETVACLCAVVQHVTHEYRRLVSLLKSCSQRLKVTVDRPPSVKMSPQDSRTLPILVLIVGLLCEHCDFDDLRKTHPDLEADLNSVTPGSIIGHIYQLFLALYGRFTEVSLRSRTLQCLGFLFRAQPALLTAEPSSQIMDAIFASEDDDSRGRLLKILQEFLIAEADKHSAKEKDAVSSKGKKSVEDVNMEELVGNTDGFAESGVSSAIVQRYLQPILDATLSRSPAMQAPAVDILAYTIKQGLAHPLQCFPVIVALETSANTGISTRASHLHGLLHSKHTSLLNTRYVASARASFDFQKKSTGGIVQGYRLSPSPTALLHRWYTLVREKRPLRQDFLKALVKVFDVDTTKTTQDDVDFVRYMAENFATFDYRTQEEVLTVLKYLTSVLSTTGMQLVEAVSPSHLLKQLHEAPQVPGQEPPPVEQDTEMMSEEEMQRQLPLIRSSVVICIIMILKTYLKNVYGISEDKCSKWVVGKKSTIGDRQATRRNDKPLSWELLTTATTPILCSQDLQTQRAKFLEIWSQDGVNAEPEDDFFA